jgi:DNA primase
MWGLQGIGLAARYAWRLFIPVFQYGQIVTWTTRTISDIPKIRYVSADRGDEAISRTRVLLGEDYCRHAIIICEGPFDVFRIGPGAVATLGVSYSRAQVARMSKYPVRIVCFDNDTAGQERAQRLCSDLAPFPGKTVRITLDAKDAASANEREVSMIRSFLE